MGCYDNVNASTGIGNTDSGTISNFSSDGKGACINPAEFDKMVDYNSKNPFKNLKRPPNPQDSTYWDKGWVTAPANLKITFSQYIEYQKKKVGENMKTYVCTKIPSGSSYTGKGNGRNNPINVSMNEKSKKYGVTKSSTSSSGRQNAIFPDMKHGLAFAMAFYVHNHNGKNLCQLNNSMQGFYENDEKVKRDCVGMTALRLRWISNYVINTGIEPNEQLNMNDKETLFALMYGVALNENGVTFQRGFLESAYQLYRQIGW